ncbi:urease accessory protein UreH domain-containing protein [Mesobacillus foraminis]|uniref:urease accessory protein UreH domain-containing protein n=1 Tax=Mesobacillus foraminis TaxID=279826 RepID=UPI00104E8C16|nr:sulfite exporter TauE/SafE family protein [Mesobacillus foraminis]
MEEVGLLSILSLGFILGIKHAVEPDHVIAVSTVAGQSRKLSTSALTGVFWGIGHTATLFLAGVSIILLKGEIPEKWAMSLEFLVGIMLVYFGVSAFLSLNSRHPESQSHHVKSPRVPYGKSIFMGFIHGLAGSAAMILLTMSTVSSIWEGVLYIMIFGAGTIIGMLCFTTIIGIPFILSTKNINLNTGFARLTGLISAVFGFYYMYNLGVTEGLFKLWIQ